MQKTAHLSSATTVQVHVMTEEIKYE